MTTTRARGGALAHPPFARFWVASVASNIGTQMNNIAKVWVLWELTGSPVLLGLESLCWALPMTLLSFVVGPLIDRYNRATLLVVAAGVEVTVAAVLGGLAWTGALQPWMLLVAASIDGTRNAVEIPARTALVPRLVPTSALLSAQSLSSVVWSAAALIGPAVGGLALAAASPAVVFWINALGTLVAIWVILPLRTIVGRPGTGATSAGTARADLVAGLRYVWRRPELRALQGLLLAIVTVLIGVEFLLPVLTTTLWNGGSAELGLLRAAPGLAAIVAGLALSTLGVVRRVPLTLGLTVTGGCLCLAGFLLAPMLSLAIALFGLAALGLTVATIVAGTRIQLVVDDEYRGRVAAIGSFLQVGLPGLAAVAVSGVAAAIHAQPTLLALVAVVAVTGPALALLAHRGRAPGPG